MNNKQCKKCGAFIRKDTRQCGKCNPNAKVILVCVDCGKANSDRRYKRCQKCFSKYRIGKNHWHWRGGKAKCIVCSKELDNWNYGTRCQSCAKTGSGNTAWVGGKISNGHGYVMVYAPNHPTVKGKRRKHVLEHRLVMEKHIGRYLKSDEIVHHINGIKNDNRIKNLMLVTRETHENNTLLRIAQRQVRKLERKIKRLENKLKKYED
jgi:hypothetical protein